ncbi:hypothetical protein GCM10025792_12890 [Pseudonocardia tropica]
MLVGELPVVGDHVAAVALQFGGLVADRQQDVPPARRELGQALDDRRPVVLRVQAEQHGLDRAPVAGPGRRDIQGAVGELYNPGQLDVLVRARRLTGRRPPHRAGAMR